jgi:guanylate kinase
MDSTNKKMLIITAPSGAGKTSIKQYLMQQLPCLAFSVSAATRAPRATEIHGQDYYFITTEAFKQHIQQNDFVEWEMVYEGKYYGTLKTEIERIWAENKVPVLDIDVKGAIHVQQQYPNNSLSLFIEPPSVEVLRNRLLERGTETPETLADRVNKASYELSFKNHFKHSVINQNLTTACNQALTIVSQYVNN